MNKNRINTMAAEYFKLNIVSSDEYPQGPETLVFICSRVYCVCQCKFNYFYVSNFFQHYKNSALKYLETVSKHSFINEKQKESSKIWRLLKWASKQRRDI